MPGASALRIATRGSALALWQARHIARLLGEDDCELVVVETSGDKRRDVPIHTIGGQGVFTKEIQDAVLDGRADIAVHSAKDLPSTTLPGLDLAAVPERGDPRDALVGSTLSALPAAARVATGSVRRRAQLSNLRPDLTFAELRGNMDTRRAKAADHGAVVVAAAAFQRLGWADDLAEILEPSVMVPQVAQGALAVECRAGDEATRDRVAPIEHRASRRAVDAERAYLAALGGGCNLPAGAYAVIDGDDVTMTVLLATHDGRIVIRETCSGPDPGPLGAAAATRVLDECGGRALLTPSGP